MLSLSVPRRLLLEDPNCDVLTVKAGPVRCELSWKAVAAVAILANGIRSPHHSRCENIYFKALLLVTLHIIMHSLPMKPHLICCHQVLGPPQLN